MEDEKTIEALQIIEKENLDLSLIESNASRAIELVNTRVEFFRKIKTVSLKMTGYQDWTDQNGKPYLQGSGAEKLKGLWGIYIKNDVKIETIPDGDLYYCRCSGTAGSKVTGEESFFIGGRSANDPFFSRQKQLDKMDVEKASYTNFEVNAITRLLGLRGLTWEDIAGAGIKKGKTTRVAYQKGKEGGQTVTSEIVNLRTEIANMALEYVGGDVEEGKKLLEKLCGFNDTSKINTITRAKEIKQNIEELLQKKEIKETNERSD